MGQDVVLASGEHHHRELQALGRVDGHQPHHALPVLDGVGVRNQRHLLQELGQGAAAGGIVERRGGVDQFGHILVSRGRGRGIIVLQVGLEFRLADDGLQQLGHGQALGGPRTPAGDHVEKPPHPALRRRSQTLFQYALVGGSLSGSQIVPGRQIQQAAHGGIPELAPRRVDHPLQGDRVGGIGHQLEIGQHVPHFLALVELQAAHDLIRDPGTPQGILQRPGLGVGPVQDGHIAAGQSALDLLAHDVHQAGSLILLVQELLLGQQVAVDVVGPQVLALALLVVGDDPVGRRQDVAAATVILLQAVDDGAGKVILEVDHVLDAGPAPGVDGLVVIPDGEKVAVPARQQLDQQQLQGVRVLELVHQHVGEAPGVFLADLVVLFQQMDGVHDQVVEVQGVVPLQGLVVRRIEFGVFFFDVARSRLLDRRGRQVIVLETADHRACGRGVELLQIEVQPRGDFLEQALAVIGVEDRESGLDTDGGPVAAQNLQARGVEGADPERRTVGPHGRRDALAHFLGGPVGEGERQDAAGRHGALGQQPGHPGRQHTGLAAAGPCDHQDRTVAGGYRLLLGVVQMPQQLFQDNSRRKRKIGAATR